MQNKHGWLKQFTDNFLILASSQIQFTLLIRTQLQTVNLQLLFQVMKLLLVLALILLLNAQWQSPYLPSTYFILKVPINYTYNAITFYGGFPSAKVVQDGKQLVEFAFQYPEDLTNSQEFVYASPSGKTLKIENLREFVVYGFFKTQAHCKILKCLFLVNFTVVFSETLQFQPNAWLYVQSNGSLTIQKITASTLTLIMYPGAIVQIWTGQIENLVIMSNQTKIKPQRFNLGRTLIGKRKQIPLPLQYNVKRMNCCCLPALKPEI